MTFKNIDTAVIFFMLYKYCIYTFAVLIKLNCDKN